MDYCRAFLLFSGFALPVFGGVGGGGGVDNVQFAYIARYRLRILRYLQALARFKLESSGFRQGRNFMWFPPKTLHTTVTR